MTIEDLRKEDLIVFEAISGSKAFGLDTPQSDTDIKGVFVLPENEFFGQNYIPQINNESSDIVFYELGRFVELLLKNNPNIIGLLYTPDDCIISKKIIMDLIPQDIFLSRLCEQTFGNYAWTQIKKARGLNKKIVNPVERDRKSILDFCYVQYKSGSLSEFLRINGMKQELCGLTVIPHMVQVYGLYYNESKMYKGIVQKESSNEICLSSVPKGENPIAVLSFNKDGYSQYCKDYKEYWEWVEARNESRFQINVEHGKNYDSKNMMHVFRLLTMAEEIGRFGKVIVRRPDREYLLSIKNGNYTYEELVQKAEFKMAELKSIYRDSPLPAKPNENEVKKILISIRKKWYCGN